MNTKLLLICIGFLTVFLPAGLAAQDQSPAFEVPTTNSHALIQQRIAATDIEVIYNRPSVKGRVIFGKLLPWDQVWRTGSDAATKISFSTPVSLNGTPVEAGSYELFSVPGKSEWIIILQENHSQWGSYAYNQENDVARIKVKPVSLQDAVETFTISFDDVKSAAVTLNISWEKVRVPLQITVDIRETVLAQLEAALMQEGRRPYFRAAMFYFENDLDINRAAELMELAVKEKPNHIGMLYRLALILERKGDFAGARDASKRSLQASASAGQELREEYTRLNNQLLARLKE
jgi:Protein of unknown function (DUF2911)